MSRSNTVWTALLFVAVGSSSAGAGELALSGSVTAELRTFPESAAYGGQLDGQQASVVVEPTLDWESADRRSQVRVLGFWRRDGEDEKRSHYDLREAYWRRSGEQWELLLGVNRVFWGVTESRHLVDVVNQTDSLEGIDGEDKLGQPMVELATQRRWGRLSGFALLGFRERSFPGEAGRLRAPLPVAGDAVFESAAGRRHVDIALRWSHSLGPWDFGVHLFDGTGREPRFVPEASGGELVPHYDLVNQAGVDVQYTRGAWLAKLEALARSGQGAAFGASVIGFEHTRYQILGTSADLGLLAEYLWDGRDVSAPPTPFEDDLFLGVRLGLNDLRDTQILAGVILDRHDGSKVFRMEAERRVGHGFSVELEASWFLDTEASPGLSALGQDDLFTVRLSRHF